MTKPPELSVSDLASFISTCAVPLTIITCSLAVCQCHGTVHPVGTFAKIIEAALVGFPLCTDPVAQVGKPGIVVSFMSATLRPLEVISCAEAAMLIDKIKATVNRQQHKNFVFTISLLSM